MAHENGIHYGFDEMIKRAKLALVENQQSREQHKRSRFELWEKLLGPAVYDLLRSRDIALDRLADGNRNTRLGALSILLHHWGIDTASAAVIERMSLGDPDAEVREVSLIGLCRNHTLSNDSRLERLLIDIVRNSLQPESLRKTAYFELFDVHGVPVEAWPDMTTFRFPNDIDWNFMANLELKK